jgi:hypothetical protein
VFDSEGGAFFNGETPAVDNGKSRDVVLDDLLWLVSRDV